MPIAKLMVVMPVDVFCEVDSNNTLSALCVYYDKCELEYLLTENILSPYYNTAVLERIIGKIKDIASWNSENKTLGSNFVKGNTLTLSYIVCVIADVLHNTGSSVDACSLMQMNYKAGKECTLTVGENIHVLIESHSCLDKVEQEN